MLTVDTVSVKYASVQALFRVSLDVPEGSVVAVLGANGAGKSTLARAVSGLVPCTEGIVTFDGADITGWPPHKIRRAGLVYIPEGRGIFPGLTVHENIRMALQNVGTARCGAPRWSGSATSSRRSSIARASAPAPCPAANNRCWRSPMRSRCLPAW